MAEGIGVGVGLALSSTWAQASTPAMAIAMRGTYPGISSHLDAVIRKVLCDKLAPKAIIDAIRQRFKYILFHVISTYSKVSAAQGLLTWSGLCSNQLCLGGTFGNTSEMICAV